MANEGANPLTPGMGEVTEALQRLREGDPGAADQPLGSVQDELRRLAVAGVKLRYFIGLPIPEVAAVLQVSPRTSDRLRVFARARL